MSDGFSRYAPPVRMTSDSRTMNSFHGGDVGVPPAALFGHAGIAADGLLIDPVPLCQGACVYYGHADVGGCAAAHLRLGEAKLGHDAVELDAGFPADAAAADGVSGQTPGWRSR